MAEMVDDRLKTCFKDLDIPEQLAEAMNYSLLAGGKRVRPVLCLSWAGMLGLRCGRALDFAVAVELVHSYSLIHDDLPCMDDDDLRRGKPTSHKVFGQAMAVLAGDALQSHAFYMMTGLDLPAEHVLEALRQFALAAGPAGMVGGQVVDMDSSGRDRIELEELKAMHAMKTGALIRASCVCGAMLARSAGAGDQDVFRAAGFGEAIGLAFQIVDDILDIVGDEKELGKPVGSDVSGDKATYPRFLGIDQSRQLAQEAVDRALDNLAPYTGPDRDFLAELAWYMVERLQ